MILLLLAPAIAVGVLGLGVLCLYLQRRNQMHLVGHAVLGSQDGARPGAPSVLFFSSATCAICHTAQRPVLDILNKTACRAVAIR